MTTPITHTNEWCHLYGKIRWISRNHKYSCVLSIKECPWNNKTLVFSKIVISNFPNGFSFLRHAVIRRLVLCVLTKNLTQGRESETRPAFLLYMIHPETSRYYSEARLLWASCILIMGLDNNYHVCIIM